MKYTLLLIGFLLSLSACKTTDRLSQTPPTDQALYQRAIETAMYATDAKVYDQLVAINENNDELEWKTINGEKYLLVVTWKQDASYYKNDATGFYDTEEYNIWVTAAPELLQRIKKENPKDVDLRLKQLLGLPPNPESNYTKFVEFWVKPSDLFRPCPDAEINDATCEICFPSTVDTTHRIWINDNRISRFYGCGLFSQYPWTQLGYTYDWNANNSTHIGLSEFVIRTNSKVVVKDIYDTKVYLDKQ
jgi:hypothetical protein